MALWMVLCALAIGAQAIPAKAPDDGQLKGLPFTMRPGDVLVNSPLGVLKSVQNSTEVQLLSPQVVVHREAAPAPPPILLLHSPALGIHRGSAISAVDPSRLQIGLDGQVMTLIGRELSGVASIAMEPPDDVQIVLGAIAPDGSSVGISVSVGASADPGARRFVLRDAAGKRVPELYPGASAVLLAAALPELDSVSPALLARGSTQTITLRGQHLRGLPFGRDGPFPEQPQIRLTPAAGLTVGNDVQANDEGTLLTLTLSVASDADPGERLVQVITASGESTVVPGPRNTLRIDDGPLREYTPLVAPLLGVRRETATSQSYTLFSSAMSVVRGPAVLTLEPVYASLGERTAVRLTGQELAGFATLQITPDSGVEIVPGSTVFSDDEVLFEIDVAADASLHSRRISLLGSNRRLDAPHLLEIRAAAPEVHALSPTFVLRDGSSQVFEIQGARLSQTNSARIVPDDDFIIESYTALGPDRASLRLRVNPAATLGGRLVQVLGPGATSSAVAGAENTLYVIDRAQVLTPVVSSVLGVRKASEPTTAEPLLLLGSALGVVRGPVASATSPASVARGGVTRITVTGSELALVDEVLVEAADALQVSALDVLPNGSGLSFDLNVATDAELGPRRLRLRSAGSEIGFAPVHAAMIEIVNSQVVAPIANPDTYSVNANSTLAVPSEQGVLVNDSNPLGGSMYAVLRRLPLHGTLNLQSNGSFVYSPNRDFIGVDRFEYSAGSGSVVGAATQVSLMVSEINDAVNDSYSVNDNAVLTTTAAAGLLANDLINGTVAPSIELVSQPTRGQITIEPDGSFVYTPNGNAGVDRFNYRLLSAEGESLPAEIAITVIDINEAPIAVDDIYAMDRGSQLVRNAPGVMANDTDPDGDVLIARPLTQPQQGTLVLNSNGSFTYTPPADFLGEVSFLYEIQDPAGLTASAQVRILVNDNLAPVPDAYSMNEGDVLFVDAPGLMANDSVVAQGPVRVVVTQPPTPNLGSVQTSNDGSFLFTPLDPDVSGVTTFRYRLEDNAVVSPSVDVRITIIPVNDPPDAQDDRYLTDENATLEVDAPGVLSNDTDVDSAQLTARLHTPPSRGLVTVRSNGSFTYVPDVNFRGIDQFEYQAVDEQGAASTATVTIDVTQPPTATNDVYRMDVNETLVIDDVRDGLLANDHDAPENDPLTVVPGAGPMHGVLELNSDGTLIYIPDQDYQGLDVFYYQVTDTRSLSNVATVTLAVGITSIPQAVPDAYELFEDQLLVIPAETGVLVNDLDADTPPEELEAYLVDYDSRNIQQITVDRDGGFQVRPVANFNGSTFFIYQVFDGRDISNAARVDLTVHLVNDGIVAEDDQYPVLRNTVLVVPTSQNRSIRFNDQYDDDFEVRFEILEQPTAGQLNFNTVTGAFQYTPDQDFSGNDSFVYRAYQPATGIGDSAVVRLRTNGPPIMVPDAYEVDEDSVTTVAPDPMANDSDPDGDPLRYTSFEFRSSPSNYVRVRVTDLTTPTPTTITASNHFYGVRTVGYSITDGYLTSVGTITVTVRPVPDDPICGPDNYLTQQNTALVVNAALQGVLGNDFDPDRSSSPGAAPWAAATGADLIPLRAELISGPANGSLTFNEIGTFSYVPNADFSGVDEFRYRAVDGTGRYCPITTARVRVNSPAQAVDDAYVVNEDTVLNVSASSGLLVNDIDIDNDTLSASFSPNGCHPCNGQVTVRQDGGFTYRPSLNFNGQDEFYYRATDGVSGISIGRVGITVLPVNDAPVTEPDTYRTPEDVVLVVPEPQGVLRNDEEVDGELLTEAQVIEAPSHGSVQMQADGAFTYVPAQDFFGRDTFRYRVFDESGLYTDEDVEVIVTPVNDAPVANPDQYSTDRDQTLTVSADEGVLANDTDVDGPQLTAALIGPPAHGQLDLQTNGAFTYVPNGVFVGVDQFQYQVDDGLGAVDAAVVSIVVRDIDTTVVVLVEDDYYRFDAPGTSVDAPGVLGNDRVEGATSLLASLVLPPSNGSLTLMPDGAFTYQANPGFHGIDGFTYAATAGGVSELARVTLDVLRVANLPPIAVGEQFGMLEDGVLDSRSVGGLLVNDSDFEGAPLSLVLVSQPQHGQLTAELNGDFVYRPNADFHGVDAFDYRVSDGELQSNLATATITVFAQNDAPIAQDDLYQTLAGQTLVVAAADGLLANDSDVDGDTLYVELIDSPVHGQAQVAADGAFVYQPLPGFVGSDPFRYAVSDGQLRDLATVRITVTVPGNQAPLAQGENYAIDEDHVLRSSEHGALTDNDSDPDGDPLAVILADLPLHGTLTMSGNDFEYRPNRDFFGTDRFTYRVSDGALESAQVTASIVVHPVNDPPLAQTDRYQVVQAQTLTVATADGVLANDSDVENDPITAAIHQPPGHGTLQLQPDGSFIYQPNSAFSGQDEFAYLASDGQASSVGRVIIDVTQAANLRPVAVGESFLLPEDTVLDTRLIESLLANDYDPEGQPLTLVLHGAPALGTLEDLGEGHIRYTPLRDFVGEVRIDYSVSDGELSSLPVQVAISYTPINDPPVAQPDLYAVPDHLASLSVAAADGVLANDRDPDGDTLITSLVRAPASGALSLGLDGSFQYTPVVPRAASDSFRYRVSDPAGLVDEAEVGLLMNGAPLPDSMFSDGFEASQP